MALIDIVKDVAADWLSNILNSQVTSFTSQRIGTGQIGECHRLTLTYAEGSKGPASVIIKIAASDEGNRQTGSSQGLYESEVKFYSQITLHDSVVEHLSRNAITHRLMRPAKHSAWSWKMLDHPP
jgi:hypothetical protein